MKYSNRSKFKQVGNTVSLNGSQLVLGTEMEITEFNIVYI